MQIPAFTIPDAIAARILADWRAKYGAVEGEGNLQTFMRVLKIVAKDDAKHVEIPLAGITAQQAKVYEIDTAFNMWS